MKKQYTRKQIQEAINYWSKRLQLMNETQIARTPHEFEKQCMRNLAKFIAETCHISTNDILMRYADASLANSFSSFEKIEEFAREYFGAYSFILVHTGMSANMPDILAINIANYYDGLNKNTLRKSPDTEFDVTDDDGKTTLFDESNVTFIEIKGNSERTNLFNPSLSLTIAKTNLNGKISRKIALKPINKNAIFGTNEFRMTTANDQHFAKFIECMTKYNANLPASNSDQHNLSRVNQAINEYRKYFHDVETDKGIIVSEFNDIVDLGTSVETWFNSKSEALTNFIQFGYDDNAFLVSTNANRSTQNGSRALAGIFLQNVPSMNDVFRTAKFRLRLRIRDNGSIQLVADVKAGIRSSERTNFNSKEYYPTGKLLK